MEPRTLEESLAFSRALLEPCDVDTTVPAWRAAEEAGWDMSLVRDSLRKPAWQRVEDHARALAEAEELRSAYLAQYGGPGKTA